MAKTIFDSELAGDTGDPLLSDALKTKTATHVVKMIQKIVLVEQL
jgi:hypothetical protein